MLTRQVVKAANDYGIRTCAHEQQRQPAALLTQPAHLHAVNQLQVTCHGVWGEVRIVDLQGHS